uniref:Uncharacterized protein n=1 Tax=Lepeophtheirus salmonis TaxID=72036 RepID=A0A0K2UQ22_LEPSM
MEDVDTAMTRSPVKSIRCVKDLGKGSNVRSHQQLPSASTKGIRVKRDHKLFTWMYIYILCKQATFLVRLPSTLTIPFGRIGEESMCYPQCWGSYFKNVIYFILQVTCI